MASSRSGSSSTSINDSNNSGCGNLLPSVLGAQSGGILIQGALNRKRTGKLAFGRWTMAYFVLYGDSLQYYDYEADFKENRSPKAIINIGSSSSSSSSARVAPGVNFVAKT